MDQLPPRQLLSNTHYYSQHFMDLGVWEPSVRQVCKRHGFECVRITPGIPGTYPTFIVDCNTAADPATFQMIVIKFFGPLFGGGISFETERVMGHYLVHLRHELPSPAVLAEGQLSPEWKYLIFEGMQGLSLGQGRIQIPRPGLERIAGTLGRFMKQLHASTAADFTEIRMPGTNRGWQDFIDFLIQQYANCHANHIHWEDLPQQLFSQLPGYLLPVEQLVDLAAAPHLIHADLTADHLLGRMVPFNPSPSGNGHSTHETKDDWENQAVIDWGDARVGNILYELVALHLDLFQADKHLLEKCLEQYGLPSFYQHEFAHKAMCMVLLHQFPMPKSIYAPHANVQSLDDLAIRLFGLPGR